MATHETRSTRSNAPSRSSSSTAPAPAPDRASQARTARADMGVARRSAAPSSVPQSDGARVSAEAEDSPGGSGAGSLLQGLQASFHPSGDWGQGYLGLQTQREGNRLDGQFQFSLDTPNLQANGAGEGSGFAGIKRDHTGLRAGAFGQLTANGVVTHNERDRQLDARARAGLGLEARAGNGVARLRAGGEVEGTVSVSDEHRRTDTTLGATAGLGFSARARDGELAVKADAGAQLTARRATTTTGDNGSSFTREGVVAVGPGVTFEAGGTFARDPESGATTLGAHLVIPTPFGVSLGGGFKATLSPQDLPAVSKTIPGP